MLLIHDKAVIDFDFWKRCRHECAVYTISRVKENMVYAWWGSRLWHRADPRNHGVTYDRRVTTRQGHLLRIICYTDPLSGQSYESLTSELDLPPGAIAEPYRRRWEAEKVFHEIKKKLGDQKAWATSRVAREAQALLTSITHNLLVRYEQELVREHGVTNEAEDRRRTRRTEAAGQACENRGTPLTSLVLCARRATQRSVKFVRWLRHSIRDRVAEATAVPRLRASYASL